MEGLLSIIGPVPLGYEVIEYIVKFIILVLGIRLTYDVILAVIKNMFSIGR
jgi:hypothetical protein